MRLCFPSQYSPAQALVLSSGITSQVCSELLKEKLWNPRVHKTLHSFLTSLSPTKRIYNPFFKNNFTLLYRKKMLFLGLGFVCVSVSVSVCVCVFVCLCVWETRKYLSFSRSRHQTARFKWKVNTNQHTRTRTHTHTHLLACLRESNVSDDDFLYCLCVRWWLHNPMRVAHCLPRTEHRKACPVEASTARLCLFFLGQLHSLMAEAAPGGAVWSNTVKGGRVYPTLL